MIGISSLFGKFKSRELEEISFRRAVADSVRDMTGYEPDHKNISRSGKTVFLNIPPAAKNAIFLKKNAILDLISNKTTKDVSDIR